MGLSAQQKQIDSLYALMPDTVASKEDLRQVKVVMDQFLYRLDYSFRNEELLPLLHNAVVWTKENQGKQEYYRALSWYLFTAHHNMPIEEFTEQAYNLLNSQAFNKTKEAIRIRIMLLHVYLIHQLYTESMQIMPIIISENERFNRPFGDLAAKYRTGYANIYFDLRLYEDAIRIWHEEIDLNLKVGETDNSFSLTNNIGVAYQKMGELDSAMKYFQLSLKGLTTRLAPGDTSDEDRRFRYTLLSNIGKINMKKGRYENAIVSFKDAYFFTKNNQFDPTSFIYNLAELYHLKEEDETALLYLDTLYRYKKQLKPNKYLSALKLEYKCAIKTDNKDRAFQSIIKYENFADSLYSATIKNQHSIALVKYRTRQKETELTESKETQRNLLFLFGMAIIFFAMVIALISQRLTGQRKKIENEAIKRESTELRNLHLEEKLTLRQKEIGVKLMYLVKKNEFIASISKKLKGINKNLNDSGKKELFQVIRELESMNKDDTWNEFEMRFKEIHEDFYNTLAQLFPKLTPNELRLCAFLKLNLSTKEISSITYQSPESIKTARYRLRKKLNLDRETNLTSFIHSL